MEWHRKGWFNLIGKQYQNEIVVFWGLVFVYDANGMRTKRTNGSTTYSYVYNGSQLSYMSVGSNELYFSYDGMGNPLKVLYNGTQYHYVTNLQGDVLRILDEDKNTVVEYTYDAWGKLISTTGTKATTLGAHNPLRYRGYVYDTETGLYYLHSRYYNPAMGRFINADVLISTGQGVLGNNMFAYCNNNPVAYADPSGHALVVCLKDDHDPTLGMFVGLTGGGGVGGYSYSAVQSFTDYFFNSDEKKVIRNLEESGYAFYRGALVIMSDNPWGLFSFGIILLNSSASDNLERGVKTLKHEYGHFLHLWDIGAEDYFYKVVTPSFSGTVLSQLNMLNTNYYDLPWERIAEIYGDVKRGNYASWSKITALIYWLYTLE